MTNHTEITWTSSGDSETRAAVARRAIELCTAHSTVDALIDALVDGARWPASADAIGSAACVEAIEFRTAVESSPKAAQRRLDAWRTMFVRSAYR